MILLLVLVKHISLKFYITPVILFLNVELLTILEHHHVGQILVEQQRQRLWHTPIAFSSPK